MGILAAALPFVASGISALLGHQGVRQSNAANAHQAQLNRDFQERMSSTSWQRSVEDMRKAGLNPALAYQQGGASSPGGATAAPQQSSLGAAATNAMATMQSIADLRNTQANTAKTLTETEIAAGNNKFIAAMLANQSTREATLTQFQGSTDYINLLRKQLEADLSLTNYSAEHARLGIPMAGNRADMARTWWGRNISPFLNDAQSVGRLIR